MWKTLSENDLIKTLAVTAGKNQRMQSYNRIRGAFDEFSGRKMHMIIAPGTTFELKMHEFDPGSNMIEITVAKGAKLKLTSIMSEQTPQHGLYFLKIMLEEDATYESLSVFLGNNSPSFIHETHLVGERSSTTQKTIFFGSEKQQMDIFSSTFLDAKHTKATITAKGVLNDEAQVRFDGAIEMSPKAGDSDAHLHEHTILLSPQAKIHAIPALKIMTNDVRASHAASVTRIDDEHMFYLNSRGIDESSATKLIIEGFLSTLSVGNNDEDIINALLQKKIAHV